MFEFFKGFTHWTHWTSFVVVVGATILIIATDVPLAVNDVKGDTYSEMIRNFTLWTLVTPAFAGVVCGHWFWPGNVIMSTYATIMVLCSVVLLFGSIDLLHYWRPSPATQFVKTHPQWVFALCFYVGHVSWPIPPPT